MKAISLWQPWASAMASDIKHNETRSWPTSHRGELAICSAKRKPSVGEALRLRNLFLYMDLPDYQSVMKLPYGCVLCVVELFACEPSKLFHAPHYDGEYAKTMAPFESAFGDYTPGRWIWMTRSLRILKEPIPAIGRQGLFYLSADVEASVRHQMIVPV